MKTFLYSANGEKIACAAGFLRTYIKTDGGGEVHAISSSVLPDASFYPIIDCSLSPTSILIDHNLSKDRK